MAANCMGGGPGEKKCGIMMWEDYGKESKDKGADSEAQSRSSGQPCEQRSDHSAGPARPMAHTKVSREVHMRQKHCTPMAVLGPHPVFFC